MHNNIVQSNNIKVFYPIEAKDVDELYSMFLTEKCDLFFSKNRNIEFSLSDFNSYNLLCKLQEKMIYYK